MQFSCFFWFVPTVRHVFIVDSRKNVKLFFFLVQVSFMWTSYTAQRCATIN